MVDKFQESTLNSENVFHGKILDLWIHTVRLADGRTVVREVVDHPGAVCLVAIDSDDSVLLVRQFRKPTDKMMLEIPAGTLSPGESPEACAQRELQEETGYTAGRLELLGTLYSAPGFCSELLHAYLATDLSPGDQAMDDDEDIEIVRLPFEQALVMALSGDLHDAKSIASLAMADMRRR
jgi:nudix-type nucleoside diphosphatase (YffH/AdpP family)